MTIRPIDKSEIDRYNVLADQSGSIFNSTGWLDIFGDPVRIFAILDNDKRLIGGFHLYIDHLLGIQHIKNPPFTPNCGLFYDTIAKNKSKQLAFEKNIISDLSEFLCGYSGIKTLSFPTSIKDFQPFYWKKYKVIPNYTYHIDLKKSQEEIFEAFSPERRNDLKKAKKDGLSSRFVTDFTVIRELVIKTFDRQKDSIPLKILDRILFQFANPSNSFAIEVNKDDKAIAGIFCVFDQKRIYYLLGGYDSSNRHSGAVALAIWDAIKKGIEFGAYIFDFEGSMIPQVEKFFRDFGGDLVPYYTINKAWLPLEFPLKLIKRNRF